MWQLPVLSCVPQVLFHPKVSVYEFEFGLFDQVRNHPPRAPPPRQPHAERSLRLTPVHERRSLCWNQWNIVSVTLFPDSFLLLWHDLRKRLRIIAKWPTIVIALLWGLMLGVSQGSQAAGVNLGRPWNFFRLEPTFVAFTWVECCWKTKI